MLMLLEGLRVLLIAVTCINWIYGASIGSGGLVVSPIVSSLAPTTQAPTIDVGRIIDFTWIDPITDNAIGTLENDGTYLLVGNENIDVSASFATTSTAFHLWPPQGADFTTSQGYSPWAIFNDAAGDFFAYDGWQAGLWTIEAKALVNGVVTHTKAINFTVSFTPTSCPTSVPTSIPTRIPTTSFDPTSIPTLVPTTKPLSVPTALPSAIPTNIPTSEPTRMPTGSPTAMPTSSPTSAPTSLPTLAPTSDPTSIPTLVPTTKPLSVPTALPSAIPTNIPTSEPTRMPTGSPTAMPTSSPTSAPTSLPTLAPTSDLTSTPTVVPTTKPLSVPTALPSAIPTNIPTSEPTRMPTGSPTAMPTSSPTSAPTSLPTLAPTSDLTSTPTVVPSTKPLSVPTAVPTGLPSGMPTGVPTIAPTTLPTENAPTSEIPTSMPSGIPTKEITIVSTLLPTRTQPPTTIIPTVQCSTFVGPPLLIQSRFTNDGARIHFYFDVATDRGGYSGNSFTCSKILNLNSIDRGESCIFLDDSTLEMTCTADSQALPGDSVQVLANSVRSSRSLTCASDEFSSVLTNITILPALNPMEPIVVLTVPNAVGSCTDIVADASASIGGGGRALSYEWTVSGLNSTSIDIHVDSTLIIPSTIFADSTISRAFINLTAVNFLGIRSQTQQVDIEIRAEALPTVVIQGGRYQTTDAWRTLKLFASAAIADCDGNSNDHSLTYTWTVMANAILVSNSADPRAFTLPAYYFAPGAIIDFLVNVTDGRTSNYAQAQVTVRRSIVVASINGLRGTELAVNANASIILDASTSYDQDNATAPLEFAWSCVYYESSGTTTEQSCSGQIRPNDDNSALEVTLYRAGIFRFDLIAFSSSLIPVRNDSTFVQLIASNPNLGKPIARVESSVRLDKINPSTRLTLIGKVMTPIQSDLSYFWYLEQGALSQGDLLSSVSAEFTNANAHVELLAPLVLESNTLIAGANYILVLNVQNAYGEASTTIAISCNAAPSSGSVSVTPSVGTALETRFSLSANDWTDDDYPLTYTFYERAPFNTSTRSMVCAASIVPGCDDVSSAGNNQTNAILVDIADIYGATAISDPPATVYVKSNLATQSIVNLDNLTETLLQVSLEENDVDGIYQILKAGGEAANELDLRRRLVACDNEGDCAAASVAAYRAKPLVAFDAVIRLQDDNLEARARQANLLSILTKDAYDLDLSAQNLVLGIVTDLTSRASLQGLGIDASRADTRAAMIESLANIEHVAETANNSIQIKSFLSALDNTLDAFLIGTTAGQDAERESSETSLAVTTVKAYANRNLELEAFENTQLYISADVLASDDYTVAIAELATFVYQINSDILLNSRAVRLRMTTSTESSRRRLATSASTIFLTLPQGTEAIRNEIISYNVTAECLNNSTIPLKIPCNGTNATILCNGTATLYNIECRKIIGPVCAEYINGTEWIAAELDTVQSSNDANITCRVALLDDDMITSRDFSTTSNSALEYYISAIEFTTKPGKLVQHPLLLWTFGIMTALCFGIAVLGKYLDRRDARRLSSRVQPGVDNLANSEQQQNVANRNMLHAIASHSMPRFVNEIRKSQIFFYAMLCVWRNHSILTVLTRYKPTQPRARRAYLVYFTCLMIMLSQVAALWLAFPTGYCESAETQSDCVKRRNLYYEVLKNLVELFYHESGTDQACEWKSNRAKDESKCQLKVPSVTDIGTKRILLVFLVFALSLPCILIIEFFYVTYACAPILQPRWVRNRSLVLYILKLLFKVIDPESIEAKRREQDPFHPTDEDDAADDDDDDFGAGDFDGGAPISAESDNHAKRGQQKKRSLSIRHRVGLRLWQNLCIEGKPAVYLPLGVADYYALRAVLPVMKTIYLQKQELISIATNASDTTIRQAITYFSRELDLKWGIPATTKYKSNVAFARKVYTQLKENIIVAANMEGRLEQLAFEQRLEACALVVHSMRRDHLQTSERQLLDTQLRLDGAFSTKKDWDIGRGDLPPVSLRSKLLGQFTCTFAFIFPIWFMFIVATKLDHGGKSGKRTKRLIFIKTIVFLFFNFVVVEPLVLLIMRFALPATLYRKLLFYEDPISLAIPYDSIRLFVEASSLLSPLAAVLFALTCNRVPIRLGPEAVTRAVDIVTRKKEYGDENLLIETVVNEFNQNTKPRLRLSKLQRNDPDNIIKNLLREAADVYLSFTQKYPHGVSESKQLNSDHVEKFVRRASTRRGSMLDNNWVTSIASDLHQNLKFSPPTSHILLVSFMGCFLLVPSLARSILIRELIVIASFGLEIAIDFPAFHKTWRIVESLDGYVVKGASEIIFLWCSMAFMVFLVLTLAVILTAYESGKFNQGLLTRRAIRKRIDNTMTDHGTAVVAPEQEGITRQDSQWQEEISSFRNSTDSFDSLDGFFIANDSNAAKIARRSLRASRRGFFDDEEEDDDNNYNETETSPFAPYILADIDSISCPITATVYSEDGEDQVTADIKDDYDIDTKRTTMKMYKRFRAQAQKQILFGAREIRGAAI